VKIPREQEIISLKLICANDGTDSSAIGSDTMAASAFVARAT
jgi:hypothetical protein